MPERLTAEARSKNMSMVHNKNTKPELLVRQFLHKNGFRFRLHRKDLPGHPDIVLPKYKTTVFVNGCFWHRHAGCKRCTMPVNNASFWENKFSENIERDQLAYRLLKQKGWDVIVIWGCEIKKDTFVNKMLSLIKKLENNASHSQK